MLEAYTCTYTSPVAFHATLVVDASETYNAILSHALARYMNHERQGIKVS